MPTQNSLLKMVITLGVAAFFAVPDEAAMMPVQRSRTVQLFRNGTTSRGPIYARFFIASQPRCGAGPARVFPHKS
jgi:glutamine amidotransferase-like uncharacterized protein